MKRVLLLLLLLFSLFLGGRVLAVFLAQHALDWYAIAGGGGRSESAGYALDGTLGQALAGPATSAGYQLGAGFAYGWVEQAPPTPTETGTATPTRTATPTGTPTVTATGAPSLTPASTATPTGTRGAPEHWLYLPVVMR